MPKAALPTRAELQERLQALGSFTGWDGKTSYIITEIKPYVAPGNSAKVRGRMAVWLRSPNSRRSLIIFVDLVLAAVRFIKEPAKRGAFSEIAPTNFAAWVDRTPAYRPYPSTYGHAGRYLALAKIILGLPEDWTEPQGVLAAAVKAAAEQPDIRTTDGLLLHTLYAFVEGAEAPDPVDLPARAFAALKRRHGSSKKHDLHDDLAVEIRDLSDRAKAESANQDIVDAPVVWFAMLYLNALEWMGRIKASSVTTVVNRLADAHDDGLLNPIIAHMDHKAARAVAAKEAERQRLIRSFQGRRSR